jgi:hypothetical protein
MAREIPEVVRAAAGLAATVLDEARKLPEMLPSLPVRIIGLAMQQAMKVQQQYAGFVARGDELFTGLRGEAEPGLATFDDDEPATTPGFRDSAFDRAGGGVSDTATAYTVTDAGPADQVEEAQASLDELADQAPSTEEILDELAIDEMVGDAPATEDATAVEAALRESDRAPGSAGVSAPTAADTVDAEPTVDVATTVDVLTPDGEITSVDATVTDEGIATPEPAGGTDTATATDESGTPVAAATGVRTDVGGTDTASEDDAIAEGAAVDAVGGESPAPTDEPAGGSDLSGSQAAGTAPVDGYDSFTIAQLRGRLRGYQAVTVRDLLAYEEATRAREPYLRMLRNRLEKLEEQAIKSSPLAPRGA